MKHLFRSSVLAVALAMAAPVALTGCTPRPPAPAGFDYLPSRVSSGTRIYNLQGQWVGIVKGRDSNHRFGISKKRRAAISILMVGQSSPTWVDERTALASYLIKSR